MNENSNATMSFDRMRNMLVRAAEIRESEQQQIFDALDEIHARMSPLESVGAIRKRLSEVSDRSEVADLSQRVDSALAKLDATDSTLTGIVRSVENIVDKLAKPFAQLDGRLDGVAGKFEGVAGRMDGLEDKLGHIHKRLDDLDGHLDKQDNRLDGLPREVQGLRERIDTADTTLRERMDDLGTGLRSEVGRTRELVTGKLDEARGQLDDKIDETRLSLDANDRLDTLAERLEGLGSRLDELTSRLDKVETGLGGKLGELSGTVTKGLHEVRGTVTERPDTEAISSMVRNANAESERRHAGQLDEAMATFAELILGGGPQATPPPPSTTQPRQQQQRRTRNRGSGSGSGSTKNGKVPGVEENDEASETV